MADLRETVQSTSRKLVDAHGRQFHLCIWDGLPTGRLRWPVILLHDSLGAVELWRDFPARFAREVGCQIMAYDRPGFGRSERRNAPIETSFVHDEACVSLLPLLDDLNVEKAILFGHSVGGGMALAAAAQLPDRIAAVITESAQAFVEDRTLEGIRAAKKNFEDPTQLARLAKYHGNDVNKAQWVLDAWIETWLAPEFAGWSLKEDLRKLQCPVLAMHGDLDEFGSERHPKMIASLPSAFAGQGECVMFEGCGHVPHREKPELVLETVMAFLRRHFPGQR